MRPGSDAKRAVGLRVALAAVHLTGPSCRLSICVMPVLSSCPLLFASFCIMFVYFYCCSSGVYARENEYFSSVLLQYLTGLWPHLVYPFSV